MNRRRLLAAFFAVLLVTPGLARAQDVTVMAAASLTDAFKELGQMWVAKGHPAPKFSFASSSVLAKQIEQGAPAAIFASADEPWADYLEQRNLLLPGTRTSPLGNDLVVIAPKEHPEPVTVGPDLLTRIGPQGRIATGDPSNVPVGMYAKAALTKMGLWDKIEPRLARAENVRAALLLVERGEAPLGIVYATDAAVSKGVVIVGHFPADSHPPITYPFALTKSGDTPEARALFAFLTGPEAAAVYRKYGFIVRG